MTEQVPAYISRTGMIQTHPGCPNYKAIQSADTPAKQARVGAMEITQEDARQRITSGANKHCGMCVKIEAKAAAKETETVNIPGLGNFSKAGLDALAKGKKRPARRTAPKPSPRQASVAASQVKAPAKSAPKTEAKVAPKATTSKGAPKKAAAPKAGAKKAATPAPKKGVEVADKPYKSAFMVNGEVVSMAAARRWAEAVNGETYGAYVPRSVRAAYAAAKAAGYVDVKPTAAAK
jgi:hypothetical protein